jgi:chromosome partitioning protein
MAKLALAPCVMSFMNLKGGTGKTTLAIAVSEATCLLFNKRIVLVDCDFQGSASISILGRSQFSALVSQGKTLDGAILKGMASGDVSPLRDNAVESPLAISEAMGRLSCLPASPHMPRSERQILSHFLKDNDLDKACDLASIYIARAIRSLTQHFDIVVVDCPPGVTLFSEGAVRASDYLIVPTLPNDISIGAIEHLRNEISRISPDRGFDKLHLGTVVSKIRHKNALDHHLAQVGSIERLLDRMPPHFAVLKPYLPYCRELEGASWREPSARRKPFAAQYGSVSRLVEQLAFSIMQKASHGFPEKRSAA